MAELVSSGRNIMCERTITSLLVPPSVECLFADNVFIALPVIWFEISPLLSGSKQFSVFNDNRFLGFDSTLLSQKTSSHLVLVGFQQNFWYFNSVGTENLRQNQ